MNFICIIPARFSSTRFPGKPLALLGGKTIIQRVYEQVKAVCPTVLVATDDNRIFECVENFGGKAVMTSTNHKSGTERCFEAYLKSKNNMDAEDVIINVQGDEPFIQHSQLEEIKTCFLDSTTQIATLVKPFDKTDSIEALVNPNSPKVVIDKNNHALYFSRSVIPYLRGVPQEEWLEKNVFYKHIGIYAYRSEVLKEITSLEQSGLEISESLEQLRWLENGYIIKTGITNTETIGIDTLEDLKRAEDFLNKKTNK